MAVLGRVLQAIGWLWVVSGLVAPMFDLPNFGFFPGIILVFVARILRRQAEREQLPDTSMGPVEPSQAPPPVELSMPQTDRKVPTREVREPRDIRETGEGVSLEQLLPPRPEPVEEPDPVGSSPGDDVVASPKSSAEMIAEARRRWNTG